jgi:hypothetical protein
MCIMHAAGLFVSPSSISAQRLSIDPAAKLAHGFRVKLFRTEASIALP